MSVIIAMRAYLIYCLAAKHVVSINTVDQFLMIYILKENRKIALYTKIGC